MEIDYKKLLTGLLSKAYKLDNGKIEELFNAEGATSESVETSLLETDAQRVATLKTISADSKEGFNQGYAKAKKEEREKFENELRTEFGLDSTTTGLDLVKEIVAAKAGSSTGGEVTEDAVKKHPAFLEMERGFKKQLTDKDTEHATKVQELENSSKKNETFYGVRQQAVDLLQSFKPVESKNPTVASNLKNMFAESLKSYDFEAQADGSYLVLKDGKRYDDAHGHAVDFKDVVKQIAGNFYEFEENSGGSNGGNDNDKDKGKTGGAGAAKTFKTQEEYDKYMSDSSIPLADRIAAGNSYTGAAAEN